MIRLVFTYIVICCLFVLTRNLNAQTNFDYYHPPHTSGKWEKGSQDTLKIDTIKCYVVEPFKVVSRLGSNNDTVDIVEVSQKAMRAWNTLLQSAKIPLQINIIELPRSQADTNDTPFNNITTKNLIGALNNNTIIPTINQTQAQRRDYVFGATAPKHQTISLGSQDFKKKVLAHIAINKDFIEQGLLVRTQGNRNNNQKNIYLTLCHEMGHLLGISNKHSVPPESIMRSGGAIRSATLENYAGIGEIPLDEIDKKMLKTIYHQFFLPSQHSNPTCIPISNLPVPNSGYIILTP